MKIFSKFSILNVFKFRMAAFVLEPPPFEDHLNLHSATLGVTLSPQSELRDFEISSVDEVNNSFQSPKISDTFSYSNSDLNKDPLSEGSTNAEPHLPSEIFTEKKNQISSPPGGEATESESGWANFAEIIFPQMGPLTVQVERNEITFPELNGKQQDKDKPNRDFTTNDSFDVGTHTTTCFSSCCSTEAIIHTDSKFSSNTNSDPSSTANFSDTLVSYQSDYSFENHTIECSECVKSCEKELSTQRQNFGDESDEKCATFSPVVPDASSNNTPPLGDSPPDQPQPEYTNLADVQLDHSSHESFPVQSEHTIGSSDASPAMNTEEDDFGDFEAATVPARDTFETTAATDEPKPIGGRLSDAQDEGARDDEDFGKFESAAPQLPAPSSNSFSAVVRSAPTASPPEVSPPVEPTPTRPDAGGHTVDARLQLLFELLFPFMPSSTRFQERYLFTNFRCF